MNRLWNHCIASWTRLLLGLFLLGGLTALTTGPLGTGTAHAQSTVTITDCTDDSQLQSAVTNATSGEIITFGCSGTITLHQTLSITTNLTLDGSGQSVILNGFNGQHYVQVLSVGPSYGADPITVTLNALTIANGGSEESGGLSTYSATVNITNSTFVNNTAHQEGGAIDNFEATVNITNSTFVGNSIVLTEGFGGAVYNVAGTVNISNSTFSGNSANEGGYGGAILNYNGTVSISGSIVANNTPNNCAQFGTVSDQGYNLESGTDCGFTGTGSLQNADPQLAALADNGGPTQTMALLQTSPAIDHIPAASCPAADQRGMSRPDDGETTCDIGAYESNYQPDTDLGLTNLPANITTDATSPQGAVVTYTSPTVVDEDSPLPTANCSPTSGSTFAIGTTTVTCTVSASGDANSPVSHSFQVVVKGASAQVSDLISLVNSFQLSGGLQNSLDVKLNAALKSIQAGQTATACSDLSDFIGQAQSQSGKGLTVSQANQLIAAAKQIQAVLGC